MKNKSDLDAIQTQNPAHVTMLCGPDPSFLLIPNRKLLRYDQLYLIIHFFLIFDFISITRMLDCRTSRNLTEVRNQTFCLGTFANSLAVMNTQFISVFKPRSTYAVCSWHGFRIDIKYVLSPLNSCSLS